MVIDAKTLLFPLCKGIRKSGSGALIIMKFILSLLQIMKWGDRVSTIVINFLPKGYCKPSRASFTPNFFFVQKKGHY